MPMQDFCRNCDRELDTYMRVDSKFCNDTCRSDFHNRGKKIDRAYNKAVDAIEYLNSLLSEAGEQKAEVLRLLDDIQQRTAHATERVHWRCRECGTNIYSRPKSGQACEFCQHDKFSIIFPKRNPVT